MVHSFAISFLLLSPMSYQGPRIQGWTRPSLTDSSAAEKQSLYFPLHRDRTATVAPFPTSEDQVIDRKKRRAELIEQFLIEQRRRQIEINRLRRENQLPELPAPLKR